MKIDLLFDTDPPARHTVGTMSLREFHKLLPILAAGVKIGDEIWDIVNMPYYNLAINGIEMILTPRPTQSESALTPEQRRATFSLAVNGDQQHE